MPRASENAGSLVMPLALAPTLSAVRVARAFVRDICAEARLGRAVEDIVVLLTSEVVTNAFVHGRSDARLTIAVLSDRVRVEVGDDNSRHPRRADLDGEALDGRGLLLMDGLSERWGARSELIGKTVWFEVGLRH